MEVWKKRNIEIPLGAGLFDLNSRGALQWPPITKTLVAQDDDCTSLGICIWANNAILPNSFVRNSKILKSSVLLMGSVSRNEECIGHHSGTQCYQPTRNLWGMQMLARGGRVMISDAQPTFSDNSTPPRCRFKRFLNSVWAVKVFSYLYCFQIAEIHHCTLFGHNLKYYLLVVN